MIILSDTDVVLKLACCESLLEFLQYLKCPPNELWVLPALKFMARKKLAAAPEALRNFEEFFTRVKVIPTARIETLERFDNLDPGERQLLAIMCDDPRVKHIVTGDKRALSSIAALSFGDSQLNERLAETTVYCLESIILGLLDKRGFSVMRARVQNKWANGPGERPAVDAVIANAFASGRDEAQAQAVLREKFDALRGSLPPIHFQPIA